MTTTSSRKVFLLLLFTACITILPFLGLTDFHTKGEPREAVVAFSMLESDNWILPRNNGGEIPYKPPFFHWGIAAASKICGNVNEFTSRLPSAIGLIAMTMAVFVFYNRRKNTSVALLTAFISLTSFELHRAGANCRVDMLLTALTVCALLLLYRYWERGLHGIPWLAILLMSFATLTKGPVGTLIPCLTFGIFLLLRGVNFFKAFFLLAAWGVISLIIPLCWYWAAYLQGGNEFLDLVLEENFGRMTNTMSYDSCVNPWPYNFATLIGGYVPWILLVVISIFTFSFKNFTTKIKPERNAFRSVFTKIKEADSVNLFSIVCITVIFVFYCFPQSKRSVYLMPIYPFIAYFLSEYILYLAKRNSISLKIYGSVLACVGILLTAAFTAVNLGVIPDSIFSGRHAAENLKMMNELTTMNLAGWIIAMLPAALGIAWWIWISKNKTVSIRYPFAICILTFGIYVALDGAFLPKILHAKSKRTIASEIAMIAPESEGTIYEFIEAGEVALGDPIHFFEINFYLNDRIQNFIKSKPDSGFLLIPEGDDAVYIPKFEADGYQFVKLYESDQPRNRVRLYRFTKNELSENRMDS